MIYLNYDKLNFERFPNGETLVSSKEIGDYINLDSKNKITLKYEDDSDLIKLMFVKRHIDTIVKKSKGLIELEILYMPYSRMDRSENNSVFTLKYISDFINTLNFDMITVIEPHSDVVMALINNSTATYPTEDMVKNLVKEIEFDKKNDYLFFPDAGAAKRYSKMFEGYKYLVGCKERDFKTGKINRLDILGEVENQGFKVIIVDDLCSKGYTFYLSAQGLAEVGADEVHLVVGHCENGIYDGLLLDCNIIKSINTTNSIISESKHKKINILQII